MHKRYFLLAAIVLLAGCNAGNGGPSSAVSSSAASEEQISSSSLSCPAAPEVNGTDSVWFTKDVGIYSIQYFDEEGKSAEDPTSWVRILRSEPDGRESTIVLEEKRADLLPILKGIGNSLGFLSVPDKGTIVLVSLVTSSDMPAYSLLSLDTVTGTLSRMNVSSGRTFFFQNTYLSPSGRYLVWVNALDGYTTTDLHLIDLARDTDLLLGTNTGGNIDAVQESITNGCRELGCHAQDIQFIDDSTVQYAVYDMSGYIEECRSGAKFLRYETVKF